MPDKNFCGFPDVVAPTKEDGMLGGLLGNVVKALLPALLPTLKPVLDNFLKDIFNKWLANLGSQTGVLNSIDPATLDAVTQKTLDEVYK